MGYLLPALTEAKFSNQRDVVLNERRQNYENRPYGLAPMAMLAALFPPDHPYHWTTIGEIADLNAAQLDEVHAFFRALLPSGERVARARRRHRSGRRAGAGRRAISARSPPASRSSRCAPTRRARRRRRASCSRIASSCRGSTWRGCRRRCSPTATPSSISPPTCSPTARPRASIAGWCSRSASPPTSRPRRTRARSPASCRSPRPRRPATRSPSSSASIVEEIDTAGGRGSDRRRDRARPRAGRSAVHVPAADGRRVRRQVRSAERLQRVPRRSGLTSSAISRATRTVTAASLQRRRRRAISITRARVDAEHRAARPHRARAARIRAPAVVVSVTQRRPHRGCPSRAPAPPFRFPPIEKSTLANGLRVWTVRHAPIPVVDVHAARSGAARPTIRRGKDGLAAMTVDMLDEGSGERSAIEMHEALARLGAQLDTDIGSDAAVVERHRPQPVRRARARAARRHRRAPGAARATISARPAAAAAPADTAARHARRRRRPRVRSGCSTARIRTATRRSAAKPSLAGDDRRRRAGVSRARRSGRRCATLIAVGDCDHDDDPSARCRTRSATGTAAPRRRRRRAATLPQPARAQRRAAAAARRSRSCASATSRSRATRPTTTRWSRPTWCSAGSSSAAST